MRHARAARLLPQRACFRPPSVPSVSQSGRVCVPGGELSAARRSSEPEAVELVGCSTLDHAAPPGPVRPCRDSRGRLGAAGLFTPPAGLDRQLILGLGSADRGVVTLTLTLE